MSSSGPNKKSFLLVEDETLIRMMIADMLEALGHVVSAEAGSQADALSLARNATFDGAILDFNLGGPDSVPVAEAIASRGIPFLFASGYVDLAMPLALKDRPLLRKPFQLDALDRAINELWAVARQ
jgi:CheY-like chemotaxis protein